MAKATAITISTILGAVALWWSWWIILQLALFIMAPAVLIVLLIWMDAQSDGILFRTVGRNQGVMIDNNEGNPSKLLLNVPGDWIVQGLKVVPGHYSNWNLIQKLMRKYGIFYKGWPNKTHKVSFVHERINPEYTDKTPSAEWMVRDGAPKTSDYVLFDKPHWVYCSGVEFKCGFKGNLLIQYQSRTIDYGITVYDRDGQFYEPMNGQIKASVHSQCKTVTFEDFMQIDTEKPTDPFCQKIMGNAKPSIEIMAGQEVYILFVYDYNAASEEEAKLLRAKAQAEIELGVAKLRAQGEIADVTEAAKALKEQFPDASQDELVKTVREIGVADRIKESGLVAWGAGAMVNTGGNNSGGNNGPRKGRKK